MKNTSFGPKIKWGRWRGWVRGVLEREKSVSVQRNQREMKRKSYWSFIEKTWSSMDRKVSRICRALILDRFICWGAIESYQRQRNLDGSNAIKHLSSRQKVSRWIENLLTSYRDKFSKVSMDPNCINFYWKRKIKEEKNT